MSPSHDERVRRHYLNVAPVANVDAVYLLKLYEWLKAIDPEVIEAFEVAQANQELTEN